MHRDSHKLDRLTIKVPTKMFLKRNLLLIRSLHLKYLNIRNLSTKAEPIQKGDVKRLNDLFKKYQNTLLYSDFIEGQKLKLSYRRKLAYLKKQKTLEEKAFIESHTSQPLPLSLKFINPESNIEKLEDKYESENEDNIFQLPYETQHLEQNISISDGKFETCSIDDPALETQKEIETRHKNWMADYENYAKDDILTDVPINYGTPDPSSRISNTPCSGCGAFLHCKDTSIPGYIPSEIYKNSKRFDGVSLQSVICQRCYFLREYNMALQVRVSPSDYPKVLKTIQSHDRALIMLIIDLLDLPCSIWPGAADFLGRGRPIFVIGNKIDLLPPDRKNFLPQIEQNIRDNLKLHGFGIRDIEYVALVSAKTGFGIEDLITKLQTFWEYRGDVFLVGCTNVGKSSLFNALIQSDFCKTSAVDLMQRATISQWPGTTLNLLKFPINRPSGYKLHMRKQRLRIEEKEYAEEKAIRAKELKRTNNLTYATLTGHVGQTFLKKEPAYGDVFSVAIKEGRGNEKVGIDENEKMYAASKWCYDTPGVIQSEQVLHLLTAEELLKTLPKSIIRPKTFLIRPETTIFIGGLSRLDFVKGEESTKFTVFCSSELPITVCQTKDASEIYEDFLHTNFFAVPENNEERLDKWPGLTRTKTFTIKGIDKETSCVDVVLSSSGWVAVTPSFDKEIVIQGWVPTDCGIHLRDPLLPKAVKFRGKKIRHSIGYCNNKFYIPK